MLKRFITFFVSVCFVFVFVCSSFVSFAVAPVALVEAALLSYVGSTGYKLWVDNGTGQDLLDFITDVYEQFDAQQQQNAMTLLELGSGNYVYNDAQGNIIVTKTAADIFQSFCDWMATYFSIEPGASESTAIVAPNTDGFIVHSSFYCSTAREMFGKLNNRQFYKTNAGGCGICFLRDIQRNTIEPLLVSLNFGAAQFYFPNYSSTIPRPFDLNGTTFYMSHEYGYDLNATVVSSYPVVTYDSSVDGDLFPFIASVMGLRTASSSSGLFASLAQSVIDKATGLASDEVLVYDVGASIGATAEDIVDAVIDAYDSTTGELSITDSIAAAEVIDTPVQPYPDVNSLGLPELGLALTTRFPFSIPWDISAIYLALSAPSEPPVKTFDLIPASVLARWGVNANTSITIDLTEQKYSVLLAIIHWSCIIGFCLGLAVMTKRYIWTTGG